MLFCQGIPFDFVGMIGQHCLREGINAAVVISLLLDLESVNKILYKAMHVLLPLHFTAADGRFSAFRLKTKQLRDAVLNMPLNRLQAVFRKIQLGMPMELEADQTPELPCLYGTQDLTANIFKTDTVCRASCLCIGIQILKIIRHGKIEQGQTVIKNGSCSDHFAAVVIPQDTEVAKVPVLVVNNSIEHQHAPDLLSARPPGQCARWGYRRYQCR